MSHRRPLTYKELTFFCGQMATIIQSGISALEALDIMQEDAEQADIDILSEIEESMRQHGNLAQAVAKTRIFPNYCTQMISIGERSGNLDTVLQDLAKYYTREDEIQTSIKNAIIYPMTMSSVILVIIFILLAKVMPIFETVFNQLGTELTGMAGILLKTGILLEKYAFVFLAVIVFALAATLFCIKSPATFKLKNYLAQHNSFIKDLQCQISACHFAGIMGIVLHSGIAADEGFNMADHTNTNPQFQDRLNECKAFIREGNSFGKALKRSRIFTGVYARMITIGDKTGNLENTMFNIADMYEKNITEIIDTKIKMIEPAFLLLLSAIVAVIILSVMVPLLSIIATL